MDTNCSNVILRHLDGVKNQLINSPTPLQPELIAQEAMIDDDPIE